MKRYYIALKELGIKNKLLLEIITEYKPEALLKIFNGNFDIFLTNIQFSVLKDFFEDTYKVETALKTADEILDRNSQMGIHTAIYRQKDYPEHLIRLENPPAIIYYKGKNPNVGFEKAIACIGTRKPTRFGFNAVNYLIPQWVNEKFAIISGLATGIDRLAHLACLANCGQTIAVLAHGLDTIYPASNRRLAEEILENGGTLISEYPVGTKVEKYRFVNRNRIIVGLSDVTVAMECEEKSGSMHAIEFAHKLNIPIFCPNPGESANEEQSGLKYILESKIGVEIKSGTDYKGVIYAAGYGVTEPRMESIYIKQQYMKALLFGIEEETTLKTILENAGLSYCEEFADLEILMRYLMSYIDEKDIPIDSIINMTIETLIAAYKDFNKKI